MKILLCEQPTEICPGTTLWQLRDQYKTNADIAVLNGYPATQDSPLRDGDTVVFIARGETPKTEELHALMAARHTPGVHQKLRRACIGIAGAGGLGSLAAIALARVGIGRLIIADFDVVEPSNLNRQQYFIDQLGQPKALALKDTLRRVNPCVEVTAHVVKINETNALDLFSTVDVLIEAFDHPEAKAMLADAFLRARPDTPLVMAAGLAGHLPANHIHTRKAGRSLFIIGDGQTAAAPGQGLMAPRVGVAAHHQANAALRLLLGEDPAA